MIDGCDKKQYRPTVDENQVPCDKYMSTDCVYPSDSARVETFGVAPGCDLTSLINAMAEVIKEQDRKINDLERKINHVI